MENHNLRLISPAFKEGAVIPPQYTCKGQGVNPPLNIVNKPPSAKSFAIIVHDPDAVSGDFIHWLVWDIPSTTDVIAANSVPVGAVQGANDSGSTQYMGPCPPPGTGTHRYIFELFALDTNLSLSSGSRRPELEKFMKGHVLEKAVLTGLFSANSN